MTTELIKKAAMSYFGYEVTDIVEEMMTVQFFPSPEEEPKRKNTLVSAKTHDGHTLYFVAIEWKGYEAEVLFAGTTLADGKLFLISTLM